MKLRELLRELPEARLVGAGEVEIGGLTADSREARPGWLFVAYRGKASDLHDFAPDAVRRGAAALAVERELPSLSDVTQVVVPDGREAEGKLAAAWYGHPSRRLGVIGVTGTDGKTTTSTLIHACLEAAGRRAGLISTVSARLGGEAIDTGFHTTTPRAMEIQRLLAWMVEQGAEWAVLETTSHALAQRRTVGVEYDVAVLTNVTHEHLDEHGSWAAYRDAKARLFAGLAGAYRKPDIPKASIVNADDPSAAQFRAFPADERLTYALDGEANVTAADIALDADGSRFTARTPVGAVPLHCRLPGRYNVANALAAVATGLALRLPLRAIQAGIESVGAIRGRMERIERGQPFAAIVDFAHTPAALEAALTHARQIAKGRVIAVFGCAGERDVEKRPAMGEIAGRLADLSILTDEDRRREDVTAIIEQIAEGVRRAGDVEGATFLREPDRGAAIARAVALAQPGDVVIVCGKGHEQSMCFGTEERPWSDQAALAAALDKLADSRRSS